MMCVRWMINICAIFCANAEVVSKPGMGISLRPYLQRAAVNNLMSMVFGCSFSFGGKCAEAEEVEAMIREGFELLGGFNSADHLPFLCHLPFLDPVSRQCRDLTRRVQAFVQPILNERRSTSTSTDSFVDVLLALDGDHTMSDEDMISVLWVLSLSQLEAIQNRMQFDHEKGNKQELMKNL